MNNLYRAIKLLSLMAILALLGWAGAKVFELHAQNTADNSQASASLTYPIVDTGQTACYDDAGPAITCPSASQAFYGQDAQNDGNQPGYTLSADGLTVTDNVTGLTWTQSPDWNGDGSIDVDDKFTLAEAQAYPATLNAANYGGYSDWRLPTIKELYSLMDFRGADPSGPNPSNMTPFIDTTYFDFGYGDTAAGERTIDAQFWSSNTYVSTVFNGQTCAFGLNLADGRIKCYPADSGPITKLNYDYFVRGNTAYGVNDVSNNGNILIPQVYPLTTHFIKGETFVILILGLFQIIPKHGVIGSAKIIFAIVLERVGNIKMERYIVTYGKP
jgi:hypothetical protein